jgi:hypothetical protein
MTHEQQKLNSLNFSELLDYIVEELYKNLNNYREMFKVSRLYKDDAAEAAIKDYFFYNSQCESEIDKLLTEKKSVGKIFNKLYVNKTFPVKNNQVLDNYVRIVNFFDFF